MSQITAALNKAQKSREENPVVQKNFSFPRIKQVRQANSWIIMMLTIVAAAAIAFIGTDIYGLRKSINAQEKEINGLAAFVANTKSLSENQVQNFDFRLKSEIEDRKIQVNRLALIDGVYYNNLVKSILANRHEIAYVDEYSKDLKSQIEKISALPAQK